MERGAAAQPEVALPPARWSDYVRIARPDHWIKHVLIVPGLVLASVLHQVKPATLVPAVAVGFLSAALVASANYVLNEWLDARFDRFHPTKSKRPAAARALSKRVVIVEYLVLAAAGLALASLVSKLFLYTSVLFLLSALVYNVAPLRTKDRVFVDVISEAFNNPLRLTLGWAMVSANSLPPSSLLLGYWMAGAFLMGVKRLAEYRTVAAAGGLEALHQYRKSFRHYTEDSLLVSVFLYSLLASFFLAVFLIKYRVEYLLSLPLFAIWFAVYLRVGLKRGSTAQTPEWLFRERALMVVTVALVVLLVVLSWVEAPILDRLADPHFLRLGSD